MRTPYQEAMRDLEARQQEDRTTSWVPPVEPNAQMPEPQAFGQRAHTPQGWRWTMPAATPAPVTAPQAQPEQPATPQLPEAVQRLYDQIDLLYQEYVNLSTQEGELQAGEVPEPQLLQMPLYSPVVPLPEAARIDPTLATLAGIATMLHPMGGATYMGLPLAEREQRQRAQMERWKLLQDQVAEQYRNFVVGVKAVNDMQIEMWKARQMREQDLYRVQLQRISSRKQAVLDKIAQLERAAAQLMEMHAYRQAMAEAALTRAQTAQERLTAEKPLIEARTEQARASAGYQEARAQRVTTLLPAELRAIESRIELQRSRMREIDAQAAKTRASISNAVRGGRYLTPQDVQIRQTISAIYRAVQERDNLRKSLAAKGYDLNDPYFRSLVEAYDAEADESIAAMAYDLYVGTGGAVNLFHRVRTPDVMMRWQRMAREAVAAIEAGKPVPTPELRPTPPPPPPEPKRPGILQRGWEWLRSLFRSEAAKPPLARTAPVSPIRASQPQAKPAPSAAPQPAKAKTSTAQPVRVIRVTLGDTPARPKPKAKPVKPQLDAQALMKAIARSQED